MHLQPSDVVCTPPSSSCCSTLFTTSPTYLPYVNATPTTQTGVLSLGRNPTAAHSPTVTPCPAQTIEARCKSQQPHGPLGPLGAPASPSAMVSPFFTFNRPSSSAAPSSPASRRSSPTASPWAALAASVARWCRCRAFCSSCCSSWFCERSWSTWRAVCRQQVGS